MSTEAWMGAAILGTIVIIVFAFGITVGALIF